MLRIGFLTSGGDCQALNAAMRGVFKCIVHNAKEPVEFYGFEDGYKGLIYGKFHMLTGQDFKGILTRGGTNAITTVAEEIAKYVPIVVKLCYAIAGVVAIVGAISVYIAMNNEEQDVKKKIMMVVGACIFLVAAAQALPLFFGL